MIETAMLKVMTSEALWRIVNDTFQIFGGAAYFTDRPLERMLRDARINQIGEGANEVLASFIALAGLRGPGMQFQEMWDALHHPWKDLGKAWRIGVERIGAAVHAPTIPVRSKHLQSRADHLGGLIRRFSAEVDRVLIHFAKRFSTGNTCSSASQVPPSGCMQGCASSADGMRNSWIDRRLTDMAQLPPIFICAGPSVESAAGFRNCTRMTTISSPPQRTKPSAGIENEG
jgi:hypothetical protein